jgi:hypothetical protein
MAVRLTEVREVFRPPNFVVVGSDEFEAYRAAQMKGLGAAGAYSYKVGPFASPRAIQPGGPFTGCGPQHKDAAIDLCNRFIELLAFGGIVQDGQEVRLDSLPFGMKCFHKGSEEDPDFNNEHIEVVWQASAEAKT